MTIQYLSDHFTLSELTKTSTKIANAPDSLAVTACLRSVCLNVLEPVRGHFERGVLVHSGYRSPAVNKAVGGDPRSQHCKGEAADFHVKGHSVYEVAEWISGNIEFDQLILENFVPGIPTSGWVHCSFGKRNRKQLLTKFKGSKQYYPGILMKP
jgi:zinc D-Ala-D-Ala carboxypeptidase